jgi:hypothetical protein
VLSLPVKAEELLVWCNILGKNKLLMANSKVELKTDDEEACKKKLNQCLTDTSDSEWLSEGDDEDEDEDGCFTGDVSLDEIPVDAEVGFDLDDDEEDGKLCCLPPPSCDSVTPSCSNVSSSEDEHRSGGCIDSQISHLT